MVNYYIRFIRHCSKLIKPLLDFLFEKSDWSQAQKYNTVKLKVCLISALTFIPFVLGDNYRFTTDTSYVAIGDVQKLLTSNGELLGVIGYSSKTIWDTKNHYGIDGLELLTILRTLKHFRYYLQDYKFLHPSELCSLFSHHS